MSDQFVRKCSLIVYGVGASGTPSSPGPSSSSSSTGVTTVTVNRAPAAAQPGLDLSQFRIQFRVSAMDVDAPPTTVIRVLNLADVTAQRVQKEFQNVTLQAGYENGNFGVVFKGSIVRVRRGRVPPGNTDTFVDIMASNFDAVYNFGVVNQTLKAGSTLLQRANAVKDSVNSSPAAQGAGNALASGIQYGSIPTSFNTGGTLPRGKVLFGLARDQLTSLADSGGCTWCVGEDGKIYVLPLTGYRPGEAVVLTSQTGMLGVPEATQNGIEVRSLLNPLIKLGTRIQLDNKSITTTTNKSATGFPAYGDFQFFASTSADGFYRVLVAEHEGDTRGTGDDWVTKITALSVDQSAAPGSSVAAYG